LIMRKALAVLLAMVMIFGLIPFQALADDQPGDIKVYLKISHEDTTVLPPMELALMPLTYPNTGTVLPLRQAVLRWLMP
jgi:hypothetical protein